VLLPLLWMLAAATPAPLRPPQFVLLSFDMTPVAGRSVETHRLWRLLVDVRAARPQGHAGPEASFTLFINTGYLQVDPRWVPPAGHPLEGKPPETWARYLGPRPNRVGDVIRYAPSPEEARDKAARLLRFHAVGVELASHGVLHDNGGQWTFEQWDEEFRRHQQTLDVLGLPRPRGFRAPYLATGLERGPAADTPFVRALVAHGMTYDSSTGWRGRSWPAPFPRTGVWNTPIGQTQDEAGRLALMFADAGTFAEEDGYAEALRAEFQFRYDGARAPLVFGGHGERFGAIRKLMLSVCHLPEVRCTTHAEFADWMQKHGRPAAVAVQSAGTPPPAPTPTAVLRVPGRASPPGPVLLSSSRPGCLARAASCSP
jgi:hypothetical protein